MVSACVYMCIHGIQMDRIFGDERTSTSPSLGGFLKLGTHKLSFFEILFIYLFIYLWLCWVFVSMWGLSLVVASGGHSSSWCAGLSLSRPRLLRSTGSRRAGSVVVVHGPSCSAACGIFADQGSNPCPLHWQADSQPLRHQGSPEVFINKVIEIQWLSNLSHYMKLIDIKNKIKI